MRDSKRVLCSLWQSLTVANLPSKLGLAALKTIQQEKLKLKLGGVALGDTWISPIDFVFSWGPLLKDTSRLDDNGLRKANRFSLRIDECIGLGFPLSMLSDKHIQMNSVAEKIKQQLEAGQFVNATYSWAELENDFYNILKDSKSDSETLSEMALGLYKGVSMMRYSKYLSSILRSSLGSEDNDVARLLNGVIKKKLKIIPENLTLFPSGDELLALGVNVTVYSGQLDLICATMGTEAWLKKLLWEGLPNFLGKDRIPPSNSPVVPTEQPCLALDMVGEITQSPAALS
ncbi:hypothetical protein RIF29_27596 [Crotalaria pallida]|uniref:Uncharacterized protein n=1 Tax=Crotalaria pallida TaxID=3830 RepID=A0AAN9EPC2_CROPI